MLTIGFWFWIIYVIAVLFYAVEVFRSRMYSVPELFWWVLIFLLGAGLFGGPIR